MDAFYWGVPVSKERTCAAVIRHAPPNQGADQAYNPT